MVQGDTPPPAPAVDRVDRSSRVRRNGSATRARPRTVRPMASPELPDGREFRQMRHDVDDAPAAHRRAQDGRTEHARGRRDVSAAQRRHDTAWRRFSSRWTGRPVGRTGRRTTSASRASGSGRSTPGRPHRGHPARTRERVAQVDTRLGRIEGTQREQGGRVAQVDTPARPYRGHPARTRRTGRAGRQPARPYRGHPAENQGERLAGDPHAAARALRLTLSRPSRRGA